jgi:hypothetical protein
VVEVVVVATATVEDMDQAVVIKEVGMVVTVSPSFAFCEMVLIRPL